VIRFEHLVQVKLIVLSYVQKVYLKRVQYLRVQGAHSALSQRMKEIRSFSLAYCLLPIAYCLFFVSESLAEAYLRELIAVAQTSSPSATLLSQADEDLIIRIDGSNSVANENQSVKEFLETQDSQVQVELQYRGTDIALQALQKGQIDIAGIGRPLTDNEKAEGLKEIALVRRKIAIVVSSDNPFQEVLNIRQFAKIFRGEITNWNEIGGIDRPIRFIDRPLTSDTRENFKNYPVFQEGEFKTGNTVDRTSEDSTEAVINKLGNDGIGYMIADQAITQTGLRILLMHNVPVTDPRYPFSQPRYYIYNQSPNPAVKRFVQAAIDLDLLIDADSITWEDDADNNSDTLTQKNDDSSYEDSLEPITTSPESDITVESDSSVAAKTGILNWIFGILLLLALLGLIWLLWRKYRAKLGSITSNINKQKSSPLLPNVTPLEDSYHGLSIKPIIDNYSSIISNLNPSSLAWICGSNFINPRTSFDLEQHWLALTSYDDVLALEVIEKTTLWLCGSFFNIPNDDHPTGEIALSLLNEPTSITGERNNVWEDNNTKLQSNVVDSEDKQDKGDKALSFNATLYKQKQSQTDAETPRSEILRKITFLPPITNNNTTYPAINSGNSIFSIDESDKWGRFGKLQLLHSSWHKVEFTPPFEEERRVIVIPEVQANREDRPYRLSLRNITHQGFEIYGDGAQVEQTVAWVAYGLVTTTMVIVSSDSSFKTKKVTVINIDATRNNQDNPIVKSFAAGTYEVKVIGTDEGGIYDAWSRCNFVYQCEENGENCLIGWLNAYSITTSKFTYYLGETGIFAHPKLALEQAKNTSFTLTSDEEVKFFVSNDQLADSRGGISLAVIKLSPQIDQQIGILENLIDAQIYNIWYPVSFPQPFDYAQNVVVIPIPQNQTETYPIIKTRNITEKGFEISCDNILLSESNYLIGWVAYVDDKQIFSTKSAANLLTEQIDNTLIINIDATKNNQSNSVIKTLPRGTYAVKVIGKTAGGKYDAWTRWTWVYECDANGENCITGWENSYLIASKEFFINVSTSGIYEQPFQALMRAQNTSFTLTSESEVYFFIYDDDDQLGDNRGGISLNITRIASPELGTATQERKPNSTYSSSQQSLTPILTSNRDKGKRIVMTTYGSLGDLHPYLAIAQELEARGHYPAIAMSESFRDNIEAEGIEFYPIRPDLSFYLQQQDWEWINLLRENQREMENDICYNLMPHLRSTYTDLKQALQNADLLITHPFSFAGALVAQTTQIPWISTVISPLSMMSAYDLPGDPHPAHSAYENALKLVANDSLLRFSQWKARYWSAPVRQLRAELGLESRYDPVFEGQHSPDLVLALFSSLLASPQLDWPSQTRITGFPFYDHPREQQLSDELQHFLDTGEPPIVFTLGSSFVWTPGNFYLESAKAAQAIGYRAVLLMGQSADHLSPNELPQGIIAVNYVPYSAILPYAAAIVHHGGVGTTGQALRSGKPMLVVPFAHDQPDNAARLVRLGVGRTITHQEYTADRVVFELKELLFHSTYASRATEVSQLLELENGVRTTCDIIEAYLQTLTLSL